VPRVGFEPTAYRLRSGCSTAELSGLYGFQPAPASYPIMRPEPSGSAGLAGAIGGSAVSIAGSIGGAVPVVGYAPIVSGISGARQASVSKPPQARHTDRQEGAAVPQRAQT
jgi:hypothetical protein